MNMFDKEFNFKGQYGKYCRGLNSMEGNGLFNTNREAYVYSSIIGYLNNAHSTRDNYDKNEREASILPSELMRRKSDLRFLYHLVMLLKEEPGYTTDDYINRTFRDEADENNPEKLEKNMEIFNAYAEGGIEFLYKKFGEHTNLADVVDELYKFINDFAMDVGLKEPEIDFKELE